MRTGILCTPAAGYRAAFQAAFDTASFSRYGPFDILRAVLSYAADSDSDRFRAEDNNDWSAKEHTISILERPLFQEYIGKDPVKILWVYIEFIDLSYGLSLRCEKPNAPERKSQFRFTRHLSHKSTSNQRKMRFGTRQRSRSNKNCLFSFPRYGALIKPDAKAFAIFLKCTDKFLNDNASDS